MNAPFVAVVTGASSGIGQAVAAAFSEQGAAPILHARSNLAGIAETCRAILHPPRSADKEQGPATRVPPVTIFADITDEPASEELVRTAFAQYGYVDAWVHAAGADVLTGAAKHLSFSEKLELLWSTDVFATSRLSRKVAGQMLAQPMRPQLPSIVHIGWDQANEGMEGDSGQYFSMVKAAVQAFSKSLAKTVAPRVRVNCIAPGWIQTEWGASASTEWNQRATGESLLARWGTPRDIAGTITALCSKACEFINGQTIPVNGGWTSMHLSARCPSSIDP